MGQTEFGILDIEQQKLLESEMLTLLGITHVPENAAHKVTNWTILTFTNAKIDNIYMSN